MYILLAYLHSTDSLAQEQMASKICCVSTFPLPTPTPRGFSHHFGESTRGPRTHPRLRTATVMNARLEYVVWDPSSKNQLPSTEMVLTCWFCCHAPARMPSNKMLAAPLVQAKLNDPSRMSSHSPTGWSTLWLTLRLRCCYGLLLCVWQATLPTNPHSELRPSAHQVCA